MRQFDQSVPHQYSKVLNNRNEITSKESMRLHHTFSFCITFCLSPSLTLFPSISHYLFHTFAFIFDLTSLCPFILNHRQPHFQTATIRCETCIRKMHCTIFASCKIASSVEIFRATVYRHIHKLFHTLEFLWLLAVADSFCSFEFRYLFYLFALSGCVCGFLFVYDLFVAAFHLSRTKKCQINGRISKCSLKYDSKLWMPTECAT